MSGCVRKNISKGIRFNIFTRDGFTCQYCGRRPPDVLLVLDHILPVSRGGGNDEMNLTTSCADCNAGKSNKILGDVKPTPDADVQYLKVEQQRLEYERYLAASQRLEEMQYRVIEHLIQVWGACFGGKQSFDCPADHVWKGWLGRYSPEIIEQAIHGSIGAYQRGSIGEWQFDGMIRYVSAVARNLAAKCSEEEA